MLTQRFSRLPSKSDLVSLHLKDWIATSDNSNAVRA
jgi:hypothetical protein